MPDKKTPGPDDIVLARRRKGTGTVSIASDLPAIEGWGPTSINGVQVWREGESIPMRYEEAVGRWDCDPVLPAPEKES